MLDGVALGSDFRSLWLAAHRTRYRLLHRTIVVVLDLLVVRGFPMNEDPNADEKIVRLVRRDDALRNAVRDRLRNAILRRTKHLNRLLGALDRHLVEHDRRRLG